MSEQADEQIIKQLKHDVREYEAAIIALRMSEKQLQADKNELRTYVKFWGEKCAELRKESQQLQADKEDLIAVLKLIAECDDKQIHDYCEKNNIFCGWIEMQTFCNIAHEVIRKHKDSTQEGCFVCGNGKSHRGGLCTNQDCPHGNYAT